MTTLWYRRPAETWTEALPIGNGRLGGMVFGGVAQERIALNDDTLWSGGPQDETNPGAQRTLKEVREFLAKGDYAAADEMSKRMMGPYTASYLALGDLLLDQAVPGEVTGYRRELDLASAVARTSFVAGGTRFEREAFASFPDNVLVVRLAADGPAKIDLGVRLETQLKGRPSYCRDGLILDLHAPVLVDPTYYRRGKIVFDRSGRGMRSHTIVDVTDTDGRVEYESHPARSGTLCIRRATFVTLVLSSATSFDGYSRSPADDKRTERIRARLPLDLARRKSFGVLKQIHVTDHASLFERCQLSLGDLTDAPTDELLERRAEPDVSRTLAQQLFDFGRYLLIACSRPGTQAANLQGIWNGEMRAPWSGNYTTNINTQMNYWPAGPANLLECQEPLIDLIKDLTQTGSEIANVNYGCGGWCAHHNVDLWRHAAPVGDWGAPPADPVWAIWPMGGVWLSQHVWEHFAFGRNLRFLQDKGWPILIGACQFVLDFLVEGPDGRLTTSPSTSPEHRFRGPDGKTHALSIGTTADLSMVHDLFTNTIEAAGVLQELASKAVASGNSREATTSGQRPGSPPEESGALPRRDEPASGYPGASQTTDYAGWITRLQSALDRLAVSRILPDGRVAEWSHDLPGEDEQHRHVSHLFALHPGRQWQHDERMKTAARTSLEVRGNASTGWSLAWKINLWARLGDGEQALDCIQRLLTPVTEQSVAWQGGVYLNLFDAHPPFQIDGNFGFTAGVCEMLLQSHAGELQLLPALPGCWPDGHVRGLRARGGIRVDLTWRNGQLTGATLRSDRDTRVRVRVGEKTADFDLPSGKDFLVDPARL